MWHVSNTPILVGIIDICQTRVRANLIGGQCLLDTFLTLVKHNKHVLETHDKQSLDI